MLLDWFDKNKINSIEIASVVEEKAKWEKSVETKENTLKSDCD